jgi:hypothetical protein
MSFLDLSNVEVSNKYDVLPEGVYKFKCQDCSLHTTKAGTGRYIKTKLREQKSGTILFHNFNIENPNSKAVEIGLAQLKSFLQGAGYHNPEKLENLDDLIGLSCEAKTKIRKSESYGTQAEISYFKTDLAVDKEAKKDAVPF